MKESPPRRWPTSYRRWAEAHVLGGWPALMEAHRVVRRSIREGQRRLRDLDERDAKAAFWPRLEAETDEQLLDALSLTVRPEPDETDDDYDRRLRSAYAILRSRLDESARRALPTPPPARSPAPAPASYAASKDLASHATDTARKDFASHASPPETAPTAAPPRVVLLTRAARRQARRAFYAQWRRWPTDVELTEAIARGA